jgi:diphosphomevalonate decarboxylase
MTKIDVVREILKGKRFQSQRETGEAFAPSNIALVKYWGKRNGDINLPNTSSLSVSLGDKGAKTSIKEISGSTDKISLNQQDIDLNSSFGIRLKEYLDLFRPAASIHYQVDTQMNIPVAAGLASSACGFAALILALNNLYEWNLDLTSLSILARLGSGSAARSLWHGFVEWQEGSAKDGMDSHGVLLNYQWPEFRIGLHLVYTGPKPLSSREAMKRTVQTSHLYSAWPSQVANDMQIVKKALAEKNFSLLAQRAEANALAMHATMMSAWPPVLYSQVETLNAMHQVWNLRAEGVAVYFTQDAGPNLKLLFLDNAQESVQKAFPQLQICQPIPTFLGARPVT